MLDSDLAALYRVETKALNRAVQRNADRFPRDFMFQLTQKEADSLRCQIGTSKGRGGRRYRPYAFTEHGAVMLANVLRSRRAVAASVIVVRAFIRIREYLATNKRIAQRLTELERQLARHDESIGSIVSALRQLMAPTAKRSRPIGFTANLDDTGDQDAARPPANRLRTRK
jgi:hypothetical protein